MTVSLHKYGSFFPGTGSINDIGVETGKYFSVNYPFEQRVDDQTYQGHNFHDTSNSAARYALGHFEFLCCCNSMFVLVLRFRLLEIS